MLSPSPSCGLLEIRILGDSLLCAREVFVCELLSIYQDIFFLIYVDAFLKI